MPAGRRVVLCSVIDHALVLGSTQSTDDVDECSIRRDSVSLVRRPSGGGAVLVAPDAQVWVDLFVPRGDPLFVDDVGQSFGFFGDAWRRALLAVGAASPNDIAVLSQPLERSAFSRTICFAGLAPGEVTVAGRKVVGISQRRDRSGAWFHSLLALRPAHEELVSYLCFSAAQRTEAIGLLRARAGHLCVPTGDMELALMEQLV